jgi:hypothetical protein
MQVQGQVLPADLAVAGAVDASKYFSILVRLATTYPQRLPL